MLSLVWHRACLCCVPLPHVTEHWKERTCTGPHRTAETTTFKTAQRLNSELHPCLPCFIGIDVGFQPAYLGPRANPPLGGTGVSVAGSARLRPVVVAVLVVDDARGVVVQRLNAADRADLHPRFPAGFAAVLPLLCHPAGEQCNKKKQNTSEDILGLIPSTFTARFHKSITYMGGGQGFWLQSLMSPLGFMLDLLQKLLWTILLSTFLRQPYRRYCFPAATIVFNKRMHRTKEKSRATHRLFFLNGRLCCTSTAELGAVGPFLRSPLVGAVLHQHVVLNGNVAVHVVHHVLVRQIHILVSVELHLQTGRSSSNI